MEFERVPKPLERLMHSAFSISLTINIKMYASPQVSSLFFDTSIETKEGIETEEKIKDESKMDSNSLNYASTHHRHLFDFFIHRYTIPHTFFLVLNHSS